MSSIKQFADRHGLKVRTDVDGTKIIPVIDDSNIYEFGDNDSTSDIPRYPQRPQKRVVLTPQQLVDAAAVWRQLERTNYTIATLLLDGCTKKEIAIALGWNIRSLSVVLKDFRDDLRSSGIRTMSNHTNRTPTQEVAAMEPFTPRIIGNKLTAALDTRDWMATLKADHEPDDDIEHLIFILDALIVDYRRVLNKRKLDERSYYGVKSALTLAAFLLEEHLADHAVELATWGYDQTPTNAYELIAVVLKDAIMQFTEALDKRRMRNFQPLTDQELRAVLSLL